jgi:hypothetical protein
MRETAAAANLGGVGEDESARTEARDVNRRLAMARRRERSTAMAAQRRRCATSAALDTPAPRR